MGDESVTGQTDISVQGVYELSLGSGEQITLEQGYIDHSLTIKNTAKGASPEAFANKSIKLATYTTGTCSGTGTKTFNLPSGVNENNSFAFYVCTSAGNAHTTRRDDGWTSRQSTVGNWYTSTCNVRIEGEQAIFDYSLRTGGYRKDGGGWDSGDGGRGEYIEYLNCDDYAAYTVYVAYY